MTLNAQPANQTAGTEARTAFVDIIESITSKPLQETQEHVRELLESYKLTSESDLQVALRPVKRSLGDTSDPTSVLGRIGDPSEPEETPESVSGMLFATMQRIGEAGVAAPGSVLGRIGDPDNAMPGSVLGRLGDPGNPGSSGESIAGMVHLLGDRVAGTRQDLADMQEALLAEIAALGERIDSTDAASVKRAAQLMRLAWLLLGLVATLTGLVGYLVVLGVTA